MGIWNDRVVPHLVDVSLRSHEVGELRARVCAGLHGPGAGDRLRLRPQHPVLPPEVTGVSAVEPSDVAWRLSEPRRGRSGVPVTRSGLDGQHLAEAERRTTPRW